MFLWLEIKKKYIKKTHFDETLIQFFLRLGSKAGKFTKVTVSDCDTTKAACILHRNTTANIELDFELGKLVLATTKLFATHFFRKNHKIKIH